MQHQLSGVREQAALTFAQAWEKMDSLKKAIENIREFGQAVAQLPAVIEGHHEITEWLSSLPDDDPVVRRMRALYLDHARQFDSLRERMTDWRGRIIGLLQRAGKTPDELEELLPDQVATGLGFGFTAGAVVVTGIITAGLSVTYILRDWQQHMHAYTMWKELERSFPPAVWQAMSLRQKLEAFERLRRAGRSWLDVALGDFPRWAIVGLSVWAVAATVVTGALPKFPGFPRRGRQDAGAYATHP